MTARASHPTTPPDVPAAKPAMTPQERRSSLLLALLFASRMLGLFLLTPVFAVAARALPGGDDAWLVGLALGAYGLTQACLQIPLGMASDRWGRRRVILFGMGLFIVGGVVCALADSVEMIAVGRMVQGLGAVSAAITAWVADATRPVVRARAMAMVGGSIGLAFAVSLVLSPVLVGAFGLSGLFWAISLMGFISLLVAVIVPAAPVVPALDEPAPSWREVVQADLLRLHFGVFCLHAILVAMFLVVPGLLAGDSHDAAGALWRVYLPVILLSFVGMVPIVFRTERRKSHRHTLNRAVLGLAAVLLTLALAGSLPWVLMAGLVAFFVAFNVLEALQPALVSMTAPAPLRGLAMGVYNTAQALGVFAGGLLGGLAAQRDPAITFLFCAGLALAWWLSSPGQRTRSVSDGAAPTP